MRVILQLLGMCVLLGGTSDYAHASAWDWDAKLSLGGNYNNNPTLNSDQTRTTELFRFIAAYQMEIERYSQGNSLTFSPRITRDYYPDRTKSDLESTDLFLRGNYNHINPTNSYGLSFNISRQNVLSSDTTVLEGSDRTNSFRADDILYSFGLSPRAIFDITQRDQLLLSANVNFRRFELDYSGRSDYDSAALSGSYSHQLDNKQKIGFSAFYNLGRSEGINCRTDTYWLAGNKYLPFEATPPPISENCLDPSLDPGLFNDFILDAINENESDGLNLTLDYNINLSPTLAVRASVGIQNTSSTLTIKDANGSTILIDGNTCDPNIDITVCQPLFESTTDFSSTSYNFALTKKTEKTDYAVTASRSVSQSQLGTPQDRYNIRFNAKTQFTSRFNTDFNFRASRQQSIILAAEDSSESELFRYYYQAQVKFSYSLQRQWSVSGSYRFQYRDNDRIGGGSLTSQGSSVGLSMNYKFKRKK